ncbi:MAG: ATP synthase F1 subunit delta [Tychonema bourrellyi B0820]|uniref:ATP synthase subunit delta n=1 Tax=Tychonema bourrellyi FEM_GT703 TaxID=2040638 RepID=A0A2G4F5F0_9CYAN|nr:ATP synthase F1 subunit delta [Tychonema bourrellyi]MDQ2098542.1 ATP synthase F1 subunit delta [Tychonema bourrellyi B0820]PSB51688.1 F0F1 ATP synthase subunit delta [filamentous cyanobacterium Phorm 6]TAG87924.1 MAG: F0F1 ATP synthase subunit delta [Oscillatoriales cyanobacterium]PHX56976.1 F0F1 ATP synthase subunit delta [Tychonema bourrellyi FEM_GT703]TAH26811.1 MAG: F0F1 ATP synthase subunit delta [Oscillatoriales cyanobacterium]
MSKVNTQVLQPYASALMSLAKSNNLSEEFGTEIRSLLGLLESSEDLRQFLGNPLIKPDAKKAVIKQIAGEDMNPLMRSFLSLLIDKGRILFLEGIGKQYLTQLRELNQTVLAEVTSAVPLSDAQQQTVREKVQAMTSARQVEIETKIDADLIGGVVIKVGSQVIDASLRGQLRRLGIRLSS